MKPLGYTSNGNDHGMEGAPVRGEGQGAGRSWEARVGCAIWQVCVWNCINAYLLVRSETVPKW